VLKFNRNSGQKIEKENGIKKRKEGTRPPPSNQT
jgi:hypothetical protein